MLSTSEIIQIAPQIRTIQNFNSIQNKELRHLAKRTHRTLLNSLHLKKNTFSVNFFHELYSKDSIRFCYDGFDIDLTYITSKILSMSFPSYNSFTTLYRNKLSDIYKFLHFRHNSHYKVYNLCQERQFSSQQVFQEQGAGVVGSDHDTLCDCPVGAGNLQLPARGVLAFDRAQLRLCGSQCGQVRYP